MTGLWTVTHKGDARCRELADRHYTRQSPGDKQFCRPGRNLVLYAADEFGAAVFVWWSGFRLDGLADALECTIFRNESGLLSSELIREAVELGRAWARPNLMLTAVGVAETTRRRSRRAAPGACFRHAGWTDLPRAAGRSHRRRAQTVWLVAPDA